MGGLLSTQEARVALGYDIFGETEHFSGKGGALRRST